MSVPHDFRTWRFWRGFLVHTFSAVGVFSALFALIAVLFSWKLSKHGLALSLGIIVVSVVYGLRKMWPTPIAQSYDRPNVTVSVVEGDLFAQSTHLLIGMATTFDTAIPKIIEPSSIQGQFLSRVFRHDVSELDSRLEAALSGKEPTSTIEKDGKTNVYPLGTVAALRDHDRYYYCLAYTEMDQYNNARATIAGIWQCLDSLWQEVSRTANGGVISAPVIGGGQSRLS